MTRVMLVDDHAVVRVGFKMLLQAAPDIEVIAEADRGKPRASNTRRSRPMWW